MATTLKSNPLASTAMPAFHVSIGTVRWLLVLIFLVGCVRADSAYGSYFDTSAPIVKRGTSGSYFGFSLAQYRTTTDGGDSKNWLLVGAPLGEGNNSVGEVWRCPVTTADDDCEQLRIGDDLASETLKAGQWLGSTVRSNISPRKILVCAHRFLDDNYFAPGLCYTLKGDFQFEELWKPCKRAYYNEFEDGFCQFGTSGMIADDGTVIVGSPGSAVWKGAAFSFTTDNDLTLSDNYVYQTNNWDLQSYSYEGMAVTASSLFGNSTVYITGVPRGKGNYGMVRLYEKVRKKAPEVSSLETMMYIVGEQFGSQFGYELATADIDGNDYPDLLVGAPNYFNKKKGGAVYIYLNEGTTIDSNYAQILSGSEESRFGISIANLGDLNGDGCEDIAVGSPYNNDAGIVYIYTGSEGGTLNLAQVISGKKYGLSYFGYSLSGGLDTDENDSGDLLVGDYESSTVLLFRSRIIYNVNAVVNKEKLSQIDPNHKNCIFGGHKSACFSVDVCFEIEDNWNPHTINLTYLIEADFKRPVKRVWFSGTEKDNLLSTIELNVKESSAEKCVVHTVYIKDNWRHIRTPIGFQISYIWENITLDYNKGDSLPSLELYPGFNPKSYIFEATFSGDCKGDVCYSQLLVNVNIVNLKQEDQYWALELVKDREITVEILIKNEGESAYNTQVFLKHNPLIRFNRQITNHFCSTIKKGLLSCHINGDPLENMESETIKLGFSTAKVIKLGEMDGFNVTWNTTSKFDGGGPIEIKLQAFRNIQHPIIHGNGEPNEVRIDVNKESQTFVNFTYKLVGNDYWSLKNLSLHIYFPSRIISGDLDINSTIQEYTTNDDNCYPSNRVMSFDGETNQDDLVCDEYNLDNCYEKICLVSELNKSSIFKVVFETKLDSEKWKPFIGQNITIKTLGKLFINVSNFEIIEEGINVEEVTITVRVRSSEETEDQPIWPYALAIMMAVSILSVIIFLCYKIGFFKRNKLLVSTESEEEKSILDKKEEADGE